MSDGTNTTNTLTLKPSGRDHGCVPDDKEWKPNHSEPVYICNVSGYCQDLTNISPGLLMNENGEGTITKLHVAKNETWHGRVGSRRGDYTFQYGDREPRNGTIDPS